MNALSYTIGDPIDTLPPVPPPTGRPRDDWSHCYRAAVKASGLWIPIDMGDRVKARNLAAVSKKRRGMEAECRGTICYLRMVSR